MSDMWEKHGKKHDFTVLRIRYDDDPVVLAILDELTQLDRENQSLAEGNELRANEFDSLERAYKETRTLQRNAETALVDAVKKVQEVTTANAVAEYERDAWKDKAVRAMEREVEWRDLVETVAKATGVWSAGVKERLEALEEPSIIKPYQEYLGDLAATARQALWDRATVVANEYTPPAKGRIVRSRKATPIGAGYLVVDGGPIGEVVSRPEGGERAEDGE